MKNFYLTAFNGTSNALYHNSVTGFHSYFISMPNGGPRIELMQMPTILDDNRAKEHQYFGLVHFAIRVGSEEAVHEMTEKLRILKATILRGLRRTGDGYYEVEVLDVEGNRLEIMA
jgi:lactoylglutathione lyase